MLLFIAKDNMFKVISMKNLHNFRRKKKKFEIKLLLLLYFLHPE